MDIRKVQKTGGSSYVITLPKEWVLKHGIDKNSPLGVVVQADGTLLITPWPNTEHVHTTKVINVDDIENGQYLFRLLVGAYMVGYTIIEIKAEGRIPHFIRDCVVRFTQTAIGPEIIEEGINSITIKNLLDPTEMPFDKTIKRMYLLVHTMHEDAVASIINGDSTLAEDVIARDKDVDRLHWLISRQSNLILKDPTLAKKMALTTVEAPYHFLVGRIIERIGDHAVRIANKGKTLINGISNTDVLEAITKASTLSLDIFEGSIHAWSKKDIGSANKNRDRIGELIDLCEDINSRASKIKGPYSISIGYIAESIRRTGEYSGDISEIVINYLMEGVI